MYPPNNQLIIAKTNPPTKPYFQPFLNPFTMIASIAIEICPPSGILKNGTSSNNKSIAVAKATNIDATCKAIDGLTKPTVLILGGKDKGIAFDKLFEKIKNSKVKSVVVTGNSRYRLLDGAKAVGYENVSMTEDFYRAIDLASLLAEEGDCVLLSPACSSYDKFSDFEQRGDEFIRYVESFND